MVCIADYCKIMPYNDLINHFKVCYRSFLPQAGSEMAEATPQLPGPGPGGGRDRPAAVTASPVARAADA
jgi:hypothetical protein